VSTLARRVEEEYSASYPPWIVWNVPSTATLTSITPATGVQSQTPIAQLDCTGTGFTAGARIFRDGVPLATSVVTAGTVLRTTVFIPYPVGTINVRVQNDGQLPTNARVFTVTATARELEEVEPEPDVEVEPPEAQAQYPAGDADPPSDDPPPERRRNGNGRRRT
jgi:hypothetical protein